MKQTIIFILTFLSFQIRAQEIKPVILELAQKIEKYNILESEHVGIAGETTDQYRNFIKLRDEATIDELIELLKFKNSVVKGYVSWALADKKYIALYEILTEFLITEEKVTTQHGCVIFEDDLASEFYSRVLYQYFHNKLTSLDSLFFKMQIQQLDSVILYSKKKNNLLSQALDNNNANPKTYDRIKELAKLKDNSSALVALAKYRKQSDIPFFIKQGKNSFLAISVFPDNAFWSFLLGYKSQEKSLEFFLAISSFKNKSAIGVLSDIYKSCNSVQLNDLDEALIKNYCVPYQDLILKIWENHKTIDLTITQRLIADCPEKASLGFAKGLQNNSEYNFIALSDYYGTKDSILPLLLNNVAKYNPILLIDICRKNIEYSKFMELATILNYVTEHQFSETIPEILERLNKKNYSFEIFHLTETLLSFENNEANKELVKILTTKRDDWDSDNWSKHFRELFNEKNIKIE